MRIIASSTTGDSTHWILVEWRAQRIRIVIEGYRMWRAQRGALPDDQWNDFWKDFHYDATVHGVPIADIYYH